MIPEAISPSKFRTFAVVVLLLGCDLGQHEPQLTEFCSAIAQIRQSYDSIVENNPCGYLRVQQPLFNVSGRMTFLSEDTSEVLLFVTPNTTMEFALYVVENCAPIGKRPINRSGDFTLTSLPVGRYVAAVQNPPHAQTQGFPVVEEFNESGYSLQFGEYGGNAIYSLVTFSLNPIS